MPATEHRHKPHRRPQLDTETSPLAQAFARLALEREHEVAIHFRDPAQDLIYDFSKLWRRVDRVTGHLQRHGLRPGDRLAWLGLNHELMLVALVACARLGVILLPLNVRLAVPELQRVLLDATPRLLVHDATHADAAQALMPAAAQRCAVDALIDTASPPVAPLPKVDADAPLLLVYTSGTTGLPKGAVHTQAGVLANARASAWAHGFVPGDKVLSVLPLFHVGGLCIQTLPALLAGVPVCRWCCTRALTPPRGWPMCKRCGPRCRCWCPPPCARCLNTQPGPMPTWPACAACSPVRPPCRCRICKPFTDVVCRWARSMAAPKPGRCPSCCACLMRWRAQAPPAGPRRAATCNCSTPKASPCPPATPVKSASKRPM
jgi:acyl-CoA synthetase (AMP-forming)/AMP-acid ligase II